MCVDGLIKAVSPGPRTPNHIILATAVLPRPGEPNELNVISSVRPMLCAETFVYNGEVHLLPKKKKKKILDIA
jgi:hypothetical protein